MNAPEPPGIAATDLIWIWEPLARRIVWATPGAVRFWGERSLEDLAARRFAAEDPNARAMAMLENARAGEDGAEREARLLLFPDGAPRRLTCRGLLRDLDGPGGVRRWMAVSARPDAAAPAPAPRAASELSAADREAAADAVARRLSLLDRATTPLGLLTAEGAPLHLNPAAEALFGLRAPYPPETDLFARLADPAAAQRAASAALALGAFGHTADLRRAGERRGAARERAHFIYRRIDDPASDGALLALEAHFRAAPSGETGPVDALAAPSPEEAPAPRLASALFSLQDLKLIQASPAFRRLFVSHAPRLWAGVGAPRLPALFPESAKRLRSLAGRLREGSSVSETLDLPISGAYGRGPWALATLSLDDQAGAPRLLLQLADLGPERRSLLRKEQALRGAGAALAALGGGMVFLGPEGRVRSLTAGAAALFGAPAESLVGEPLAPRLAAPWDARLTAGLTAGLARSAETPFAEPERAILIGLDGARRQADLALAPPPLIGPKHACLLVMPAAAAGAIRPGRAFREALLEARAFAAEAEAAEFETGIAPLRRRLMDLSAAVRRLARLARETGAAETISKGEPLDLAERARAAARRAASLKTIPVETVDGAAPALVASAEDLDEALDLLLAEAAARGPARLRLGVADPAAGTFALSLTAARGAAWPAPALRAAELLAERAGGALRFRRDGQAARIDLLFHQARRGAAPLSRAADPRAP